MTNPAWVVLFTKITGLVTEAGGTVSHPAVVAREFGIPAVVGTTNAGERIKTGDRIRVNGSTGIVELLVRDGLARTEHARGGARAACRARRRRDGRRRRDVPRHPHEPGLHRAPAACSRSGARRRASTGSTRSTASCGSARWRRTAPSSARPTCGAGWPVAARRVRRSWRARGCATMATVGGVLADADYASDPPAVLSALGARAVLRSARGERDGRDRRADPGYYETCIAPDELLVEVARAGPAGARRCTASSARARREDRPCVAVAAVRDGDAPARRRRRGRRDAAAVPRRCARWAPGARPRSARRYARADRADRRRARLGGLPAAGDRGRGPARGGGGRVIGVDPRVTGAQRYSRRRRAAGDAARGVRALPARARAGARDRRLARCPTTAWRCCPRTSPTSAPYGCQVARPARARRRRALRRRHRGRGRGADRARRRAPPRAGRGRATRSCRRSSTPSRRSRRARRCCTRTRPSRRDEAVSIGVRPIAGTNVCHRFRIRHGDVAAGFARGRRGGRGGVPHARRRARPDGAARRARGVGGRAADAVDRRRRPRSTLRADLAGAFGIPRGDVRIVAPPMGGSFGAKTFVRLEALVAALARKAGAAGEGGARPRRGVRQRSTATRRRSACGSARSATARWSPRSSTAGSTPAPTPTAARASPRRWATPASGPYRIPNVRVDALRDLHQPPAQRRLPRLRRDAVGAGRRSGRWTRWRRSSA